MIAPLLTLVVGHEAVGCPSQVLQAVDITGDIPDLHHGGRETRRPVTAYPVSAALGREAGAG
ncbi:MAG TPA: hypothetical protein VGV36_01855 [Solirubrobacteraceae bacterium]|nr:hypothetical protein [Solirubrobacteraceae bacterium]